MANAIRGMPPDGAPQAVTTIGHWKLVIGHLIRRIHACLRELSGIEEGVSPGENAMAARSEVQGTIVVLVTCPSQEVGEQVGRSLVEEQLAACVNVVPGVTSIYRWEGKICRDPEVLLVIKTRRPRLAALIRRVKALHPYSVPEIIALPLVGGSRPYLSWVRDSTS